MPLTSMRSALIVTSPPFPAPKDLVEISPPSRTTNLGVSTRIFPPRLELKVAELSALSVRFPLVKTGEIPVISTDSLALTVKFPAAPPFLENRKPTNIPVPNVKAEPSARLKRLVSTVISPALPLEPILRVLIPVDIAVLLLELDSSTDSAAFTVIFPDGPLL